MRENDRMEIKMMNLSLTVFLRFISIYGHGIEIQQCWIDDNWKRNVGGFLMMCLEILV